ncbi:MAG: hypothetical protein OEV29_08180 [Thermoleophilia bacterium]|nr:hypothetical protein [Thermoleophilia bacterium]
MRWLERYLPEGEPRIQHFAEITVGLAKREYAAGEAELDDRRALPAGLHPCDPRAASLTLHPKG